MALLVLLVLASAHAAPGRGEPPLPPPAQAPAFGEVHRMLPGGAGAHPAVVLGDVDGDGDLDALVAATGPPGGTGRPNRLYRNDGDARFHDASALLPTAAPARASTTAAVALADVDGDRDLDAVVLHAPGPASAGGSELWRNDGRGGFEDASADLPPVLLGSDVVAADLDRDGDADLLVANGADDGAVDDNTVLVNDGTGLFFALSEFLPGEAQATTALDVADLDGDGDLDAFLGNAASFTTAQNRVYESVLPTGFALAGGAVPAAEDDTRDVALADLTGDGDPDAVVANRGPDALLVGVAGVALRPGPRLPPGGAADSYALAIADVDLDGDLDVLVGADGPNRLLVNDGAGRLADASDGALLVDEETRGLAVGDLDGDGDPDAIAASGHAFATTNRLYLNDGAGAFPLLPRPLPPGVGRAGDVAVADVDGDGDLDAYLARDGADRLLRSVGPHALADASRGLPRLREESRAVAAGDVDGDGDADLLVGSGPLAPNRLLRGDGAGGFALAADVPAAAQRTNAVVLADLDGDGDLDAYLANGGAGGAPLADLLWLGDGRGALAPAPPRALPALLDPSEDVAAGDVDGDGDLDLVVVGGGQDRLLRNAGAGVFADATEALPPDDAEGRGVVLLDADGDGDLDVAVGNAPGGAGGSRLHENRGGAFAPSDAIPKGVLVTGDLAACDPDGDGEPDLVLGGALGPALLANEGGRFRPAPGGLEELAGPPVRRVAVADLDGDGDDDLLLASAQGESRLAHGRRRHLAWTSLPRVGRTLALRLDGPPGSAWVLGASAGASATAVPPLGVLLLDPAALVVAGAGTLGPQGSAVARFPVRDEPSWVGADLFWQALVGGALGNLERTTLAGL